jgi:hypothetical protein
MCSFPVLSLALTGIGTVFKQVSQRQQASYQAAVARNNQIVIERQAREALARGEIAEDRQRQKTGLLLGSQRARLANQGTALDEGSPLDIQGDTAVAGEFDALSIRHDAEREAWALRRQAAAYARQTRQASSGGGLFSSLLSSATSVARPGQSGATGPAIWL